jgi:hypothetical protein
MRLAAISVDLDEVPCYAAIHGLPAPPDAVAHAVYDAALPRFEALFAEHTIAATFFAIGSDLERAAAAAAIGRLHAAGHEIGNHSFHHRYDLTRRSRDEQRDDVARGALAIESATGEPPRGFRAPGYCMSDDLLATLGELGVRYHSSIFPCPAYYAAKAAAIVAIAARGRSSHSIVDRPSMLAAPADPYRTGTPYWTRGRGLLELPIGVTRLASGRLPYIGTSLLLAGSRASAWLTRRIAGRPLVNLELHGIDLCDAGRDGLAFLRPYQPDLRVALEDKERTLACVIGELRRLGYELVTLAEAARRFGEP